MRKKETGGATLLLILVLLAFSALVGALAVRGASGDLQMAASQRTNRTAFYCAEGGLNAARAVFAVNYPEWNTALAGGTTSFTYPVVGDLDGDGRNDYSVTIRDNVEADGNLFNSQDARIIMVSTCISETLSGGAQQRTLQQILEYTGMLGEDYRYQAGHSSTHSGNVN